VEDFSIEGLLRADSGTLHARYRELAEITHIDMPTTLRRQDLVREGVS
jgi:hypothetical protein